MILFRSKAFKKPQCEGSAPGESSLEHAGHTSISSSHNTKASQNKSTFHHLTMTGRRRLSFTSNLQSQQELWEKTFGSKQQIIAVQMFFDEGAPSREEMMDIAKTLCTRFVRLRSIPVDTGCGSSREWVDVSDVDAAIDKIVAKRNLQPETEKEARIFLEKVKGQDILTSIDGIEVPLWRCYVVGDRSLVWLFDHAIGDGLSLSTLLAVVATSSPDGPPLALEDVSPAMKRILDAGIRSICFRTPLPLLWLPNTVRAVRALLPAFVAKPDNDTPLHPYLGAAIPQESFGTIYFLPLSLSLCTALAKTAQVTINDILLTCVYGTICNYFSLIHFEPVSETMQHLMPIGVPKAPSFYLDEWEGLNVQLVSCWRHLTDCTEDCSLTLASRPQRFSPSVQRGFPFVIACK